MYTATLIAGFVALSSAATIQIAVGKDGLVFTPNSVTAAKGDIIEYQFFPPTHSVNMADFNNPCMPAASGGFGSGAFTTSNGMNSNVFQVTVNSTDPIFFYCGFPTHCETGMVGAINPSTDQTLDAFQSKASGVANSVAASKAFGGQIVPAAAAAAPSTTAGATSPAPTAPGNSGSGGPYGGPISSARALAIPLIGAVVAVLLMM